MTLTFALTFCMWTLTPTRTQTPMGRRGYSNSSSALKCRRVKNVSANQRPGPPSVFQIPTKNTNLVGDNEVLEFRSAVSGEVENVSANQRLWRPFCFSDRQKKRRLRFRAAVLFFCSAPPPKLSRGCWDLAFCKVCWIPFSSFRGEFENMSFCKVSLRLPFSGFRGEVENVSANQRPWPPFCFRSARQTQTLLRTLISCFLLSFVEFCPAVLEEESKMWLVNDGRTMDNARSELSTWAFGSGAQNTLTTKKVWLPDRQTEAGQSNPYRLLCFVGDTKMTQDDLDLWARILPLTMNNLHLKFESNQTNNVVFIVPIRVVAVELWFYVTFNIYFSYI